MPFDDILLNPQRQFKTSSPATANSSMQLCKATRASLHNAPRTRLSLSASSGEHKLVSHSLGYKAASESLT